MASWSQWSSLLSTNPDPNAFNGRPAKNVHTSTPASAATSIRSFMSALSIDEFPSTSSTWGKGKGKLKKQRRTSPPPKLQPLAFTSFDPIAIPSPSSASGSSTTIQAQSPVNFQGHPPDPRTFQYGYVKIYGNDELYDGHIFEHPDLVSDTANLSFQPPDFAVSPSPHLQTTASGGGTISNERITRTTPPQQPGVIVSAITPVKTIDPPAIVTTPSSPATVGPEETQHSLSFLKTTSTSTLAVSPRRLAKKRSAPSRLPSPLPIPPVPPLPQAMSSVLSSTEAAAKFASQAASMSNTPSPSASSTSVLSTPSAAHHGSAVCQKVPNHTDSTALPILSPPPPLQHAPHSNHSDSTRSFEPSPSISTPFTSLPTSASLERSESAISEEISSLHTHQVHEIQSDCGHGGAFISGKRTSLIRNFSLSVGMSSSSSISGRLSGDGRSGNTVRSGLVGLARSKTTALRRGGRRDPAGRPPPPPSSWADVASPFPSVEGTSLSGHEGSSAGCGGGAVSDPSSPTTSGGGCGGWTSANTSTSDLGSTFARWRKWRKRVRSSTNGSSQSAFSSRTSLGVEDDVPCVPALPLPMPSSGEKKGKEKEVVVIEDGSVNGEENNNPEARGPPYGRSSLSEQPYRQSLSQDGHSLSLRPSSTVSRRDHRKSTSWSDAAAALFRSSSRHSSVASLPREMAPQNSSLHKICRASSESSHGHGSVGVVNGRRVLRKERVVDLGYEPSEFGRPNRRSKAMFTIGSDDDEFNPMSESAHASVLALSAEVDTANSTCSAPDIIPRPPLVRRDALMHEAAHIGRRRWTLADAMTDEGISDVGLVRELERMREVAEWARRRERMQNGNQSAEGQPDEDWDGWDEWDVGREILEGRDVLEMERQKDKEREKARLTLENGGAEMPLSESPESEVPPLHHTPSPTIGLAARSATSPSTSWLMAQRALLICRELILTERHYLAQLSALVNQETNAPPPPLMVHYAADLVTAASAVLRGMEREPSARGLARAFLEREGELEGAYMRWCSVVGSWFSENSSLDATSPRGSLDGDRSMRKRSRRASSKTDADGSANSHGDLEDELSKPLKRTVSTWRKSMPSISGIGQDGGSIYGGSARRREKDEEQHLPAVRRPAIRELAILPTQRVMRYVLLYRDLLSHTPPTSASRPLVERAVAVACRIADQCDRAQGNSAFIVSPASPSSLGTASRSSSKYDRPRASTSRTGSPPTRREGGSATTLVTGHGVPPVPTTSPVLSPPPFVSTTSRASSPVLGDSLNTNSTLPSRRLSSTAISLVTLGWNKSHRGMPFGPAHTVQVAAVAPT